MKRNVKFANTRLLRLVSPLIAIVLLQAFLAGMSLNILSSVRAYVGGESFWSKGQKDAVHALYLYSGAGLERNYDEYLRSVSVPLGDRIARKALEQNPPDLDAARAGFLQGGNHLEDIDGLIWLYRYFRDLPPFKKAITHWINTDPLLDELTELAASIREANLAGPVARVQIDEHRARIDSFNARFASEAVAFSESLGEGSRQVKLVLTLVNLFTAGLLVALLLAITRHFLAQRRKFVDAVRAEKERAQITLASIGDAVIRTDAQGRVEYLNPAAERLIARQAADVIGQPLTWLFSVVDEESSRPPLSIRSTAF